MISINELPEQIQRWYNTIIDDDPKSVWKKFVDTILSAGLDHVFGVNDFISPNDIFLLYDRWFKEWLWEPVLEDIIIHGIKPDTNLFNAISAYLPKKAGERKRSLFIQSDELIRGKIYFVDYRGTQLVFRFDKDSTTQFYYTSALKYWNRFETFQERGYCVHNDIVQLREATMPEKHLLCSHEISNNVI